MTRARIGVAIVLTSIVALGVCLKLAALWRQNRAGAAGLPADASVALTCAPVSVTTPAAAGTGSAAGAPVGVTAVRDAAGADHVDKVDAVIAEVNRLLTAREYMSAALTLQKFVLTERLTDDEKARLAELLLSFRAQVTGELESAKDRTRPSPGPAEAKAEAPAEAAGAVAPQGR